MEEKEEEHLAPDIDDSVEPGDEDVPVFGDPLDGEDNGAESSILDRLLKGIISGMESVAQGIINDVQFAIGFTEQLVVSTIDLAETILYVISHPIKTVIGIGDGISDAYHRGGGDGTGSSK